MSCPDTMSDSQGTSASDPVPEVLPDNDRPAQDQAAKAELLDLLLMATNDGIVDWNLVTGTTVYNPRWRALLGFEDDDMVETPNLWRELTHPDDLPKVEELLRDHLDLTWPFAHTSRMRDRHGGWRWILCRGCALRNAADRPIRMVMTFSDITERIRAEEQQRALVSAIPDSMFRINAQSVVLAVKVDPTAPPSLWSGLVVGKLLDDVIADKSVVEAVRNAVQTTTLTAQLACVEVTTTPSPGGLVEYHEIRVIASGEQEAVCIVRNVTERRSLEGQLLQAQKLQAIGHLAAGIAHEINTPLQYVGDNLHFSKTAIADLLRVLTHYQEIVHGPDSPIDEQIKAAALAREADDDLPYILGNLPKGIDRALDGVERVTRIVRAMKAFSHPGGGGSTKQMVDLNQLIENTVIVATNEWRYVADLTTELDAQLPTVPCVAGNLGQVVLNLIVNAAHAIADVVTGAEKGQITVSTAHRSDTAEIRVRDTGIGIPESIRSKVFDPFFTTKPVGKGTGQGLAMAHATVIEHGGTIHFETEVGRGTTFVIRLPLTA